METIIDKFDKEAINGLERVLFEGRIEVVESEYEAKKAVAYLLSQPILGFDTETKPQFQKGHSSLVALLQISSREVCFLFRLNVIGLPKCLLRLLSDEGETIKVGLSWRDDLFGLQRRESFVPGTFIEIQQIAKEMGLKDLSLQKLYANLLGRRISKAQRLSNWEADILSKAQKQYAATDAWACIQLYERMMQLRSSGYLLQVNPVLDSVRPISFVSEEAIENKSSADKPNPVPQRTRKIRSATKSRKRESAKDKTKETTDQNG